MQAQSDTRARWIARHWAAIAVTTIVAATAAIMRLEGRIWFCQCRELLFVVAISLVYAASKHELWPLILRNAWHTAVWMLGFMGIVFVVLLILSWGL